MFIGHGAALHVTTMTGRFAVHTKGSLMTTRRLVTLVAVCLALGVTTAAEAHHFEISLEVDGVEHTQKCGGGQKPPVALHDKEARPVLHVIPGEALRVKWSITSTAKEKIENAFIYLFIVPQQRVGQDAPPDADSDTAVLQSGIDMDFEPGATASGDIPVKIEKAGVYLVHIETRGTAAERLHEHFADIDVVVEEPKR